MKRRGFTLVELLVVMGIIAILAALAMPAVRALSKSNDQSQAKNLVASMIGSARSIAIAQHRMAGVVFFEEHAGVSLPIGSGTAVQLFVEDFNQADFQLKYGALPAGATGFVFYSTSRQYIPAGTTLVGLNDKAVVGGLPGIASAENADTTQQTRAILFDSNGDLSLRGLLAAPSVAGSAGTYPHAYLDWKFGGSGVTDAKSSPGFLLYNQAEYDAAKGTFTTDVDRAKWLNARADIVAVNGNTGGVIQSK